MPTTIHIKAFGMVAEKIGTNEMSIDHIGDSVKLLDALLVKFPELKTVKFSLAINKMLVSENQKIPENAEIALLPPFSGG
ncbi:MoaD/ThiS family protein [Algoriphagus boritolerans]|uniref:Molybdopterin synthase sulfur carrier subunit n=1 Tax=Algoriphagus boritolerans DSM 17298 = JCM 18970 TaxID=1120964 RepID=A0A1H5RWY1_9BACT|nr:MoaD/ThiS family protein [Algoriphagus boritolerans]SEF42863.1 molybdopterin synthase sulfur carrier subunit [Algoriphagus boritolerans DSM 17298 = JCM 18970]